MKNQPNKKLVGKSRTKGIGIKLLNGRKIKDIRTISSWYDNDSVDVYAGTTLYRMPASTILKMAKYFVFEEEKARRYTYLFNPKLKKGG